MSKSLDMEIISEIHNELVKLANNYLYAEDYKTSNYNTRYYFNYSRKGKDLPVFEIEINIYEMNGSVKPIKSIEAKFEITSNTIQVKGKKDNLVNKVIYKRNCWVKVTSFGDHKKITNIPVTFKSSRSSKDEELAYCFHTNYHGESDYSRVDLDLSNINVGKFHYLPKKIKEIVTIINNYHAILSFKF